MDAMGEPQPILDPLTPSAIFLVATIDSGGESAVRDLLADISGLRRSIGFRVPGEGLTCVTSIGSAAWDRLFVGPKPAELHEFPGYNGPIHSAPATPGDLFFHIRGETQGPCFELAMVIGARLKGAATIVDETVGFRYFEQRDLLGFVDGTENPNGVTAAGAVQIGSEDPDFAGGSYVHVQKYVHEMTDWRALSDEEQEKVIGRTKLEDVEMDDDVKPPNSHIALNVITDEDGNELKIVRRNMPFGELGTSEYGTYYIGYCRTPEITERMLLNMFIGDPPGNTDRILDFSTAVTGGLFFCPTIDFLDDPPPLPSQAEAEAEASESPVSADIFSLAIGSLKGIPQ